MTDNLDAKVSPAAAEMPHPLVLRAANVPCWTDDEFFTFCQQNRLWRIERDAAGELEIREPNGWESGAMCMESRRQTANWAIADGSGRVAGASTGFTLPNNATRAPDAAWVSRSHLDLIPREQRRTFLPLCPDFALEVTSPSDSLAATKAKMVEYVENGLRLGVLLHPPTREVWVYRPGADPAYFADPATVACDPDMPGFALDIQKIFDADA